MSGVLEMPYLPQLQVLKSYLSALKRPKGPATAKSTAAALDVQRLILPMEVRLSLRGATVRFEHHPLEVSCCP